MRQAELQDKRDRIRMGLIPPDAPKGTQKRWKLLAEYQAYWLDSSIGQSHEGLDF